MKYRFYDAKMNGVDWDQMKLVYEPLVNYVSEREEMQDIVNMMIGRIECFAHWFERRWPYARGHFTSVYATPWIRTGA